jgi:predicted membrane channel-forming protein YqfA (hemolysin III family)
MIMANTSPPKPAGQPIIFTLALIFVTACVAGGIYYLLPGFVHPFTTDDSRFHYAHARFAIGFFVLAALGLILLRITRPRGGGGLLS